MIQSKRVLVPVSGDDSDEAAVLLACQVARKAKGTVYLLHVVEVDRKLPLDAPEPGDIDRGEALLQRVERMAKAEKCAVEAELLQAREAGPAVVDEATERQADLIVMGASPKSRHLDHGLGSTALYVLENAPCRVWLAREPLAPEAQEAAESGGSGDAQLFPSFLL